MRVARRDDRFAELFAERDDLSVQLAQSLIIGDLAGIDEESVV